MAHLVKEESGVVSSSERDQVKKRRERLGMSISELAEEAKVSRDTLADLEAGDKDYRRLTLTKVLKALDELELEAGINAPPRVEPSAEAGLIEFEVSGDFGVRVVVKGPVANMDELETAVARLIRDIRQKNGQDATSQG